MNVHNSNVFERRNMNLINPLHEMDFPTFYGTHPRFWVLKCEGITLVKIYPLVQCTLTF